MSTAWNGSDDESSWLPSWGEVVACIAMTIILVGLFFVVWWLIERPDNDHVEPQRQVPPGTYVSAIHHTPNGDPT